MTNCEYDGDPRQWACEREEQCDDCFMIDHLKECDGCDHYDHPQATFKSIPELVEEKAQAMNLSGHSREVYRKMLETGDKENHGDYLPADEGEEMEKALNEF